MRSSTSLSVRIEEEMICDDISYRIMPAAELDSAEFSPVELKTLDYVACKSNDDKARQIIDHMHEEKADQETAPFGLISYDLANDVKVIEYDKIRNSLPYQGCSGSCTVLYRIFC